MDFTGKVVMITGSGRGIGAEIARNFAARGASVVVLSRTEAQAEKVAASITEKGGRALALACDVSSEEDVRRTVAAVKAHFGPVDILVNNAGVFRGAYMDEMSLEDWHTPFRTILDGTFLCCREVLGDMKARKNGKIVNIASAAARFPFETFGAYAAAKAGLLAYSMDLQEEVRAYGINVNSIVLGLTNTAEVQNREELNSGVPRDKMLQPIDVANAVMFLSSDMARGMKAAALELYGDYV